MSKFIKLNLSSYTESTGGYDPDDEWSRDSTSTSWNINRVELTDEDDQHALPNDGLKDGDSVYILYAVYSTGDTFGNDAGYFFEFISYHRARELAYKNLHEISASSFNLRDYSFTITLDNGEKISRHCPWDGYFESLDYVEVKGFVL